VRERTAGPLLRLYERAANAGVFDHAITRRAFESVYLAYKRLLEAGPVGRLQAFVEPGSTVVDVGANIGFFALRFGRWVGPAGRVVAIEPEARNVAALRRRISRARLDGVVECTHAAAADQPGQVRLAVNPVHPGDHHISDNGEAVPSVKLDDLVAGDNRRLALIKIDVQGAESMVLAGARRAIEVHLPAIFIELDNHALERFGSSAEELIETLAALGYRGHKLARRGVGPVEAPGDLVARSAESYIDVLFLAEGSG
jgi:FkbM family methyltransferase